jgi:hypothetical protein
LLPRSVTDLAADALRRDQLFARLVAISLRDYTLGTLAALPALRGYVSLGAFARAGLSASTGAAGPFQWALLAAGFAATALVVAHIGALVAKVVGGAPTPPA